ncbi:hypothetical protein QQP08_015143 [Theobroma cacao]|nr:hypothetical protein QQP08_015143 [Theobroma cacao]
MEQIASPCRTYSISESYGNLLTDLGLVSQRFVMASTSGQGLNSSRNYRQWLAETFDGHETLDDELSDSNDEKDLKIRELSTELHREKKKSAAYLEQLQMVLKYVEEHTQRLSLKVDVLILGPWKLLQKRPNCVTECSSGR